MFLLSTISLFSAFRPKKVVAAQQLFASLWEGVVSVYSKAENRVLNAEKAHQSTAAGRFPKGEYNILITIELRQKMVVAQRLLIQNADI